MALQLFACSLHLRPATTVAKLSNCAEIFIKKKSPQQKNRIAKKAEQRAGGGGAEDEGDRKKCIKIWIPSVDQCGILPT